MKNIGRWSLMRNSSHENIQEHSHMVAVLAQALAVIGRDVFGKDVDPGAAATVALFHDASEIFTGDMPTPVKYHNPEIITAYKNVESLASGKLLATLPAELQGAYLPLLSPKPGYALSLIKAADKLSAYIKCLEELKTGNNEFRSAAVQTRSKLEAMGMEEVKYFTDHFIETFGLTLDELELSAGRD
jgi:5'-deoxynucleotidase